MQSEVGRDGGRQEALFEWMSLADLTDTELQQDQNRIIFPSLPVYTAAVMPCQDAAEVRPPYLR